MCKIHTNSKEACIKRERLGRLWRLFIALNSFEVLYLNLIGQGKYSYQILTKQQRCWKVVKIGHQDLILTTLLEASGRF